VASTLRFPETITCSLFHLKVVVVVVVVVIVVAVAVTAAPVVVVAVASTKIFGISVVVSDQDCDKQPRCYEYRGEGTNSKRFKNHC